MARGSPASPVGPEASLILEGLAEGAGSTLGALSFCSHSQGKGWSHHGRPPCCSLGKEEEWEIRSGGPSGLMGSSFASRT